jgi:hypothetical protein
MKLWKYRHKHVEAELRIIADNREMADHHLSQLTQDPELWEYFDHRIA